jgi:hypothetical protein
MGVKRQLDGLVKKFNKLQQVVDGKTGAIASLQNTEANEQLPSSEAADISSGSNGVGSTIMLKNSSGVMFIEPVEGEASSKAESKQNYLAEVKTDVVSFAITPDEDAATEQQEECRPSRCQFEVGKLRKSQFKRCQLGWGNSE